MSAEALESNRIDNVYNLVAVVPGPGLRLRGRLAEIVREHGGIFICDEVQTGFGRTGKHWFGIEHWGVEPDVMTMAKGVLKMSPSGPAMCGFFGDGDEGSSFVRSVRRPFSTRAFSRSPFQTICTGRAASMRAAPPLR